MSTRVRAKFRCMQITHTWDGLTLVKLMPVTNAKGNGPENLTFWKYTPSGECHLTYNKGVPAPFTPGAFYYVDFESTDVAPTWQVSETVDRGGDSMRVSLTKPWDNQHGLLSASMWLELSQRRTFELYGKVGSGWIVSFSEAPADA